MPFKKIENVSINGKNQAFGGFIYSVNWKIGLAQESSTITISLISENGEYTINKDDLSYLSPYNITIGNSFNLNYYAISFNKSLSVGQKILEVTFVDGSHILDKRFVGLHKRHGDKNEDNFQGSCKIIVGNEMHPCDANGDGIVDNRYFDNPCDFTCPGSSGNVDCGSVDNSKILDVAYNFRELIEAIVQNGIPTGSLPQEYNDFYRAKHFGSLRDVLVAWCQTFGYTFYWYNEKLNFLDVSSYVELDTSFLNTVCLRDESESVTREGTYDHGFVSYFGMAGETQSRSCSDQRNITCSPINLRDIYGDSYKGIPINNWEAICALSKYSPLLRDHFLFYTWYDGPSNGKKMPLLGLEIDKLIEDDGDGGDDGDDEFGTILNEVAKNLVGEAESSTFKKKLKGWGVKFFTGTRNQSQSDRDLALAADLANNFIGRYYLRAYTYNEDQEASASLTDGTYYPRDTPLAELPLNKFGNGAVDETSGKTNQGYILVDKVAPWVSDFDDSDLLATIEQDSIAGYEGFIEIQGGGDAIGKIKNGKQLFMCTDEISNTDIKGPSKTTNTREPRPKRGKFANTQNATYGLLGRSAVAYSFSGFRMVLPANGSVNQGGLSPNPSILFGDTIPQTNFAGFRVILEWSYNNRRAIPKVESVRSDIGVNNSCNANISRIDVEPREIGREDITVFTNSKSCVPDSSTLDEIHNKFNQNLSFSLTEPFVTKSFSIHGIDLPITVGDYIKRGVISVNISWGSDGVYTQYTFSNKQFTPPQTDFLMSKIEFLKNQALDNGKGTWAYS